MKKLKTLFAALALCAPLTAAAQDIEINAENFPDENFRKYLLAQDYGEDGVLTETEIQSITHIGVSVRGISSLKGIEHFTALTYLSCFGNQLTTLDVSNNTALTILYCSDNQLTTLDVSNNTELTDLDCGNNQLTTLDVSNNTKLGLLYCSNNQLTTLDVSKNTALTYLSCDGNQLTTLDVSNNTALTSLKCYNNQLTTLDVSNNTALTRLHCDGNQLTTLDVSNNTKLTVLFCYGNQIKSEAMNALVSSLPETTSGFLYVYDNSSNEGNVITKAQVAAAKAKGWTSYGSDNHEYGGIDVPITVSVDANGLATYCPIVDIDFSDATEIAAYKASVSDNTVTLTRVETVAAGEGVLLRSINGGAASEQLPAIETETEKNADNAFVGTPKTIILSATDGNVTNFVLSNVDGVVGFFKANDTKLTACKAYLPIENYDAARGLTIVFDDDTTGISEVAPVQPADDAFYTLDGVRVTAPAKGLYIKNGKKVFIK